MQPGTHRRAWCAINDHCSSKGPVWRPKKCILLEAVKQVPSRGTNLQAAFQSEATTAPVHGPAVEVDLAGVDWLHFYGESLYAFVEPISRSYRDLQKATNPDTDPPFLCFCAFV